MKLSGGESKSSNKIIYYWKMRFVVARISIFGIGYVGTVAAACLARDGHTVIAADVDQSKVDSINTGRTPIVENGLEELIETGVASGRLTATTDARKAVLETDASFVCVGTPSAPDGSVGLDYVLSVCTAIGSALFPQRYVPFRHRPFDDRSRLHGKILHPGSGSIFRHDGGRRIRGRVLPEFLRESTAIEDYYDPGLIVFGALDQRLTIF